MAHDFSGGLTGWDLEGFHSGGDTECWKRLGAVVTDVHDDERGSVRGTRFSVWAPNAQRVMVIADFNGWQGDELTLVPGSGVWARFVEGIDTGTVYKYKILTADGRWIEKADPMARFCEAAPSTASIVYESKYLWADEDWMAKRRTSQAHQEPISVYEVHLGSWRRGKTYLELAEELVEYVTWQGYTHVEFMPVAEHPFEGSWGYQVTGYFAPTSRLGRPDEFRYLVDRLHQAGIGVILDWVPGHFPKDDFALGRFDGTALYEHSDPRQGEHMDWGTYIFNYGRNEVKSFLVSNALYWIQEFHIDGLRVDAVASMLYLDYSRKEGEWVPNQFGGRENLEAIDFLRYVNTHLYEREPGVLMIAEESTSFPGVTRPVHHGGLGFGFKWNMGWMNDSLRYLEEDPINRRHHHHLMTFAMVYAYSENFMLPISHDEVVHGKGSMFGKIPQDDWRKLATLRAFYSFMWSFPGKQLLFMGQEFGQSAEFSETRGLDWWQADQHGHHGLKLLLRDLNGLYRSLPALHKLDNDPAGFRWINADDSAANVFAFLRSDGEGQLVACITNFSPTPHDHYQLGLPKPGVWTEILNTDSAYFQGTGSYGNMGQVIAREIPGGRGAMAGASVCLPPLGSVWLKYDGRLTSLSNAVVD
ncbi:MULTISPECIES: 1,4-alpha-glucan branching protein GlgB [Aestuariimicrobium]|uniref:1,4-alpha-glucan branching protein GlgB n=1 Tax=Aestuariimicrobium TaxID=396388 RepID=UPI0003B73224|nr:MULTISPECIES: 1,4-alpha-glucan branching protein GlgB [Aestuariimicrobium]CAI9410301.1 1,4-alpha-glucan branching enzyme GlgB [Aestuariimicrobium sp. T2.26MG-19.2B]